MYFCEINFSNLKHLLYIAILALLSACNDLNDFENQPQNWEQISDTGSIIILNEGLFNLNNSSITRIDFIKKEINPLYFENANNRGLGDTGNDLQFTNGYIWSIMNVSSQIEIIEPNSGISVKRISMYNEFNKAKQPRYLAVNDFIYVCSFDGSIDKISPKSFEIIESTKAGKNPDGICVSNNKIYISNSGGLDAPNFDSTVTVLNSADLNLIKTIVVGSNPGKILSNSKGFIYVIQRGNPSLNNPLLTKINPVNLSIETNFPEINISDFCLHNDTIFGYYFNHKNGKFNFFSFDTKNDTLITENLLQNTTSIQTPYSIHYNPMNRRIYITDAKLYTNAGSLHCFDENGNKLYEINNVGLNPSKLIFTN